MQREAKSNKSPYAKPLQFVLPDTMPKKRKEKQKAKPVVTSHGRTRRTAITGDSHPEELEILVGLHARAEGTKLSGAVARLPAWVLGCVGSRVQSYFGANRYSILRDLHTYWGNHRKPSFLTLCRLSPNDRERSL